MTSKTAVKENKKEYKNYPKNSIGYLATKKVPVILTGRTLNDARLFFERKSQSFDSAQFFYVLDEEEKLVGVFPLSDVFSRPSAMLVEKAAQKDFPSVLFSMSEEGSVYLALKQNIKELPVVDEDNIFVGVVPSSSLLKVLYRESHEDILKMAGAYHKKVFFDDTTEISLWDSLKHRLPWLFLGLAGGILSSSIIGSFRGTLESNILLASFIPLIVYMSDAVGTQVEAFIIRDLAISPRIDFKKYFGKQFSTVSAIALIFGGVIFLYQLIFRQSFQMGLVLAVALIAAIISSVFAGLVVPYFFSRIKLDPANASGPVATIIQDVLSIAIYFLIAWIIL